MAGLIERQKSSGWLGLDSIQNVADARSVEVCIPASTSNLGAGFDCFGLGLQLYLTVRATIVESSSALCRVRTIGRAQDRSIPRDEKNLIYKTMSSIAEQEGIALPALRLSVVNDIPVGGGLGSSAAAIVAGITLCSLIGRKPMSEERALAYATDIEGHADNVGASIYGGWIISAITHSGKVLTIKKSWPEDIRILVVSPHVPLETTHSRAALPQKVPLTDAVFNLQRTSLFTAAIEEKRYDLLWDGMQDRLHQDHRKGLVPGLGDALSLKREDNPGLLGLALSGSGPSILALVQENFDQIGERISLCFHKAGLETTTRLMAVDSKGRRARVIS
jgi:homoserine kinase